MRSPGPFCGAPGHQTPFSLCPHRPAEPAAAHVNIFDYEQMTPICARMRDKHRTLEYLKRDFQQNCTD